MKAPIRMELDVRRRIAQDRVPYRWMRTAGSRGSASLLSKTLNPAVRASRDLVKIISRPSNKSARLPKYFHSSGVWIFRCR